MKTSLHAIYRRIFFFIAIFTLTLTLETVNSFAQNPVISVNTPVTFCSGGTGVTLTASCSSNCTGITYKWSPSTGLSATSGASVVAKPLIPTTYVVIGTNSTGGTATAKSFVTGFFSGGGAAAYSSTGTLFPAFGPLFSASADFDGDGIADLAIPNCGSANNGSITGGTTVSIMLSNGNGTFRTGTPVNAIITPVDVISADFNNDGKADLAVVNQQISGANSITVYLGNGNGTFSTAVSTLSIGSSNSGRFVVSADFNNDGIPDLAATAQGTGLYVFIGNGTGGFTAALGSPIAITGAPIALTTIDYNNDGKMDIAVGQYSLHLMDIFRGNGDGTFTSIGAVNVGSDPFTAVSGDFNNDGKMDMATSSDNSSSITVLLGNGAGGFTSTLVGVGTAPIGIATGDFNGDGILDLATANLTTSNMSILLGNGTGGFGSLTNFPTGATPYGIVTGDFNGDGKSDLAVSNTGTGSSSESLFFNTTSFPLITATNPFCLNGTLTLSSPAPALATYSWSGPNSFTSSLQNPPAISSATSLNAGTYSLTATLTSGCSGTATAAVTFLAAVPTTLPALVCSNSMLTLTGSPSGMTSYLWTGPNSFTSTLQNALIVNPTLAAAGAYTLKVVSSGGCTATASTSSITVNTGPVTNQSFTLCAGQNVTVGTAVHTMTGKYTDRQVGAAGNGCDIVTNTNLSVLFGNGGAAAYSSTGSLATGFTPLFGISADFDGDGKSDIAIPNSSSSNGGTTGGTTVSIFLSNGDGTFRTPTALSVSPNNSPEAVVSADFNNDGKADLAVINVNTSNNITVYLGNGNGTFGAATATLPIGTTGRNIVSADFNGDGIADIAATAQGNGLYIFLGNGTGGFTAASGSPIPIISAPIALATADFNNDGKMDITVGQYSGHDMQIYKGNGDGTFTLLPATVNVVTDPFTAVCADFNGDGKMDIASTSDNTATISVALGNGDGTFAASTAYTVSSSPIGMVCADFNGDGKPDLATANITNGNMSVILGTGTGTFGAALTITTGTHPYGIMVGDFNADGKPDIAVPNSNSNNVSLLFNTTASTPYTPAVTAPAQACLNGTLNLSAPAGFSAYSWAGPNSFTSSVQNAVVSPVVSASAGAYTLTATVSGTCTGTATSSSVSTIPAFVVTASTSPAFVCSNGMLSLTGGPSAMTSYLWTGPNSYSSTLQNPVVANPPAGASATYSLKVVSTTGCTSTTSAPPITVNTGPVTNQSFTLCAGQNVTVGTAVHTMTGKYTDRQVGAAGNGCDIVTNTNLSVLFGNGGAAAYSSTGSLATGFTPLFGISADFDGDGKSDIAIPNSSSSNGGTTGGTTVSIFLSNGDGTFRTPTALSVSPNNSPEAVVSADFNNDGKADLAVINVNTSNNITVYLGNGNGTFGAATATLPIGTTGRNIVSADFNGDGIADIAATAQGNGLYIFLGNGTGGFTAASGSPIPIISAPIALATADFNNDGKMDITVGQYSGHDMQIYKGNGDGTFTLLPATVNVVTDPFTAVCADFNGDGKMDIASTSDNTATISVALGNGDGTFAASTAYTVSSSPIGMVCADFNGDGKPDLATANITNGNMSVILGTGTGTFGAALTITTGTHPYGIMVGDFNADGKPDIAVPNSNSNNVSLLFNTTSSTFALATATGSTPVCPNSTLSLTGGPAGMSNYSWAGPNSFTSTLQSPSISSVSSSAAGVYTLTVTVDAGCTASATTTSIAVTNALATASATTPVCTNGTLTLIGGPNGMTTYLWTGPNSYSSSVQNPPVITNPATTLAGAYTLKVTSGSCTSTASTASVVVNKSSLTNQSSTICPGQNIMVGTHTYNSTGTYRDKLTTPHGCDSVFITKLGVIFGSGTLSLIQPTPPSIVTGFGPQFGASADFDGDGKMDLAIPNSGGSDGSIIGGTTVSILLSNGDGTFRTGTPVNAIITPVNVIAADFNHDGRADLAVVNQQISGPNSVTVYLGNGNGTFSSAVSTLSIGSSNSGRFVVSGDFNNDGNIDLAATGQGTGLYIFLGNGSGGFTAASGSPISIGSNAIALTTADYNNDGNADLAVGVYNTGILDIFLGNGTGVFSTIPSSTVTVASHPFVAVSADFNGDGNMDIASSSDITSTVSLSLGNGSGGFTAAAGSPFTVGGSGAIGLTYGDFNGDGKLDLATANNTGNNMSVLLGNGTGGFGSLASFPTGTSPFGIINGDFNGDGRPDLVVDNSNNSGGGSSSVAIFLNANGAALASATTPVCTGGSHSTLNLTSVSTAGVASYSWAGPVGSGFTSSSQNPVISGPTTSNAGVYALKVTDSQGCTSLASTASVVVNSPTTFSQTVSACGSFTVGTFVHTSSGTYTDVITSPVSCDNAITTILTILPLKTFSQSFTFCAGKSVKVGTHTYTTTGTYIDVLTAHNGCDSTVTTKLTVQFGNGGAAGITAAVPATLTVGFSPQFGTSADFDGDGIPDLAIPNSSSANNGGLTGGTTVSIMLSNGDGTFRTGTPVTTGSTPVDVTSADFNGDGKADIAVVNQGPNPNTVTVYLGNGNGTFGAATATLSISGTTGRFVISGDFNNDGKADLIATNQSGGATGAFVFLGNGDGTFTSAAGSPISIGNFPLGVTSADFNGDGNLDLAVGVYTTGVLNIYLGNGSGGFTAAPTPTVTVVSHPFTIISADFNGDGKIDIATTSDNTSTMSVVLGNGSGGFTAAPGSPFTVDAHSVGIISADLNGDGISDLVTSNNIGNDMSVLLGNGSGGFGTPTNIASGAAPYGIITGDFNVDGKPDLAVDNSGSGGSSVAVFLNTTATLASPASASSNTPVCPNSTLSLSGGPSGLVSYSWSGPNSYNALGQNPALVNPGALGGGVYSLTVTDSRGCSGTANTTVALLSLPPLAVSPASAVCTGLPNAILTASGASTYTWAPTANLTPSAGTSATETAQISQLTFYTVTGVGSNSCSTTTIVPVATVATGGIISPNFSIICSGNTKTLTVTGAAGHDYQWQISSDNVNWTNITGATNTTYTTASGDGATNKFYRLLAQSNSCWNVASTTAEVDVSVPTIPVTASGITDNSLTLNWSPTGTGNYTISYSGPTSATQTSVTPAKTITGLTANSTYSITVTQTGVGCAASGTVTGVTTLCAMPTGVTLSSPASSQILVSWTGVVGADYRVYYRPLFSYNTYFTKDVSNVSSVLLTKQGNNNLYASTTYEVYVSRLDCPATGAAGQGTNPTNVTTLPNVSCATPSIDSVRSLCPVQIEVFIHDNGGTNQYNVFIQRITPTILAVNSYGVTGTYFTISVPYSGDQFLIALEAKCGGAISNLFVWPGNVTVKPLCISPGNLVLSNPTCHGFTASWNADQCLSNSASGYELDLRVLGTLNYNSYGVPLPANGIGPNKLINFVTSGRSYQVFVRSIYNCSGYVTYGPSSQVQTITTLSSGCRDEDAQQPEETKPAVQQYAQDNSEVFSLYPNPNNGEFVVDLSRYSSEEDAVRIEVINMIGQTVMTHLTTISGGHMSEFINLPNGTAAGTYMVRLTAGKNVYTAKINVSK